MINKARRLTDQAKCSLVGKSGATFFIALCFKLIVKYDEEMKHIAATDGDHIFINPAQWMELNKDSHVFILLHETLHVAYDHHGRKGIRNKNKWNAACDYSINDILVLAGFKMPPVGLHDEAFRGMSAEQIYDLLPNSDEEDDENGDMLPAGKESSPDARAQKARKMISEAVVAAKVAKDYDSIPGALKRDLELLMNPPIPWEVVLNRVMNETCKNDYSWKRPNRRYMPILIPGLHSNALERIVMALDTSGSVDQIQFSKCTSSLYYVIRKYKPKALKVIQFDHEIQESVTIRNLRDLMTMPLKGGGGTYLEPVMQDYIKDPAKLLVVLTDGYFSNSITNPNKAVVWLVYDNPDYKPPFGKVIHFNM